MNRMGHVAEKRHYIQIRQEGRQSPKGEESHGISDLDLQRQNAEIFDAVVKVETLVTQGGALDKFNWSLTELAKVTKAERLTTGQLKQIKKYAVGIQSDDIESQKMRIKIMANGKDVMHDEAGNEIDTVEHFLEK